MLISSRPTILVIDDAPEIINVLMSLLLPQYRVLAARSGEDGLRLAARLPPPNLILLDVVMPQMNGYEVLARLRADPATRGIPVIFLTMLDDVADEERGLDAGVADYVTKPIRASVLRARVRNQLEAQITRDWLIDQKSTLEAEVERRMVENNIMQEVTIRALAHLAETRDPETGNHLQRTQNYVQILANQLRTHPRFSDVLTPYFIDLFVRSAPLHDIGKVGIPDSILLKNGRLTPEEMDIMKTHARLGSDAIEQVERDLNQSVKFLSIAKEVARWHHERWDGSGYPDGLVGEAIPISARLMAVADVFDAITSRRIYKGAMPTDQARDIIVAGRGSLFDPDVVSAFIARYEDFEAVALGYRERAETPEMPLLRVARA